MQVTFSFLMLSISPSLDDTFFWVRMRFLGLAYGPIFYLTFALEFTHQKRGLTQASLVILSIIPTITTPIIWFFPDHFFAAWQPVHQDGINTGLVEFTGWYSIHLVYSFLLGTVGTVILIHHAIYVDASRRKPVAWFTLGMIISSFFLAAPLSVGTPPGFRITPIGLGLQSLCMGWALLRYDAFRVAGFAYDLLFQSMKDASLVLDNQNKVVQVNPAAEKLLKRSHRELIDTDVMSLFPGLARQVQAEDETWRESYEMELKLADSNRTYDAQFLPVKRRNDRLGSLIVLRDITDRKQAEQERIQLEIEQQRSLALHQFIDDSTHDLMTPLSIVNTSLYILQKTRDEATRNDYVARIATQIQRLQEMFQDMLLMSQLDWDTPKDRSYNEFDFNRLFQMLAERYQPEAEEKHIVLTFVARISTARIPLNEEELSIVLSKLIDNAITYIPTGGAIRIESTLADEHICVSVSDNGPGITRADLMHIFDRFYRAQAHRPTNSGAGLGLSIARRIVELHGGQIEAKSEVGEGSTFTVSFPTKEHASVSATLYPNVPAP